MKGLTTSSPPPIITTVLARDTVLSGELVVALGFPDPGVTRSPGAYEPADELRWLRPNTRTSASKGWWTCHLTQVQTRDCNLWEHQLYNQGTEVAFVLRKEKQVWVLILKCRVPSLEGPCCKELDGLWTCKFRCLVLEEKASFDHHLMFRNCEMY